jgi:hypothetical protein
MAYSPSGSNVTLMPVEWSVIEAGVVAPNRPEAHSTRAARHM